MAPNVTDFEMRVLRIIKTNGRIPIGDGLIKYVAAAQRLARKGLAGQSVSPHWFTTKAGDAVLESNHPEPAP